MGTPLVIGDAVLVQTATTGTGTYTLGAAMAGHLTFAQAGIASGSRVCCTVVDSLTAPTQREVFEGVYTSGSPATVTRALVVRNHTGTQSAVSWGTGTKYLFVTPNAARIPLLDTDGLLPNSMMSQALTSQLSSTVARSIPHATATTFSFDTVGANTLGGASGSGGNYNGVVLPMGGIYSVEANVLFASNGTGIRNLSLVINNSLALAVDQKVAAGLGQVGLRGSWRGGLNTNDTLTMQVSQDSGAALVAGGTLATNLTVVRL
jgi:hypothetical protein